MKEREHKEYGEEIGKKHTHTTKNAALFSLLARSLAAVDVFMRNF